MRKPPPFPDEASGFPKRLSRFSGRGAERDLHRLFRTRPAHANSRYDKYRVNNEHEWNSGGKSHVIIKDDRDGKNPYSVMIREFPDCW